MHAKTAYALHGLTACGCAECVPPPANANAFVSRVLDSAGQPTAEFRYTCADYFFPDPAQSESLVTCLFDGSFVRSSDGLFVEDPATQLLACLDPCVEADLVEALVPVCDANDVEPCVANANPCDNGNQQGRDWGAVCLADRRAESSWSYTCACSIASTDDGQSTDVTMVPAVVADQYTTCIRKPTCAVRERGGASAGRGQSGAVCGVVGLWIRGARAL